MKIRRPPADEQPTAVVEVLRLIDPEHREPFVSLGRIFLACGVTPAEGLLRFRLDRLDYSTTLGELAPLLDLWVPLRTARRVAAELSVLDELAALLEWPTRGAYSVEDKEEGGLVHNWRIASDRIPSDEYSTARMLSCVLFSTPFPRLHLLPPGAQVRTLLPPLASFPSLHEDAAGGLDAAWSKLIEWSIVAYEAFLDGEDAEQSAVGEQPTLSSSASPSTQHDPATAPSLAPFFLFSTLSPLLHALDALPRTLAAPPSATASTATHLSPLGVPHLPRGALLPGHAQRDAPRAGASAIPPEAELYLADAVARVVLFAHGAVALGRGELGEVLK
ncbi:hypothetical protein DMC30DRAFT_415089 [Rhodotorula diobovata]|uniref:Uncharacterized protein n=1 Tax=Rhodotorula diobovata TaxID=5288 RepID=A0A5C5G3F9_9BASI|nr:hypothetical protein DMC30DRAFT_415089 [Rhodotorula diobovata]